MVKIKRFDDDKFFEAVEQGKIQDKYKPRFISESQLTELVNLYHTARIALSGKNDSKYNRMLWACDIFHKKYLDISTTAAYKDLSACLEGY